MIRWEYLTVPLLKHNTKAILDNFGDEGWELVALGSGMDLDSVVAYLKRPKEG